MKDYPTAAGKECKECRKHCKVIKGNLLLFVRNNYVFSCILLFAGVAVIATQPHDQAV